MIRVRDPRLRRLTVLGLALLAVGVARPARAGQAVLQNDNVVDFGTVAIWPGFVAGERAAAWLTSTCDGEIVAVRILWLSDTQTAPPTLGEWIHISQAGTFPAPGPLLLELLGPQMIDGGFNEFSVIPSVPVLDGETVVVDFKFLDPPPGQGPSLVTDIDGCQSGRNSIFAIPPSAWLDDCVIGVTGDWAIRAVVDCSASNAIFVDGFESGDTSVWSSTVP